MLVRILGPIEAEDAGDELPLGGPKQRLVVAVLALEHPSPVASTRLADALWGEAVPRTAAKTIQVFVARLRKSLGQEAIVTREGGYVLKVSEEALDHRRFERLAGDGARALAESDHERARERLAAALGLWRGPALGELPVEGRVAEAVRRLEELRLVCLEKRIEADVALGRASEVVGELEQLMAAEPLRERPAELLMLAYYRAGRQADALAVFQRVRRVLVDEIGIEPGPRLRELQAAVLAQDEALAPPAPAPAVQTAPPVWRRPRSLVAVGAVALIGGALVGASAYDDPVAPKPAPNRLVAIDSATARIVDSIPVGSAPVGVAAALGAVWVASAGEQTVERVDPRSRAVTGRIGIGRLPSAIGVGEGAVWVGSGIGSAGSVSRLEPDSSAVVARLTVRRGNDGDDFAPATPSSVVAAHGAIWANRGRGRIVRIPLRGGSTRITRLGASHSADGMAATEDAVWVASSADDRVLRLHPRTGRLTASVPIAGQRGRRLAGPLRVAAGAGAVWVVDTLADSVSRIDPRLAAVTATLPVGRRPTHIAIARDAVWVLNADDATVARLDPRAGRVTARVRVPGATGLAASRRTVWVTVGGGPAARPAPGRLTTLRAVISASCSRPPRATGDVLVVSDLPTWGGSRRAPVVRDMRRAIRDVLERRGYRAGRHRVVYQECDDSERAEHTFSPRRCSTNARTYAANARLVGVIGPYHSACAAIELPILNAAPGGPVPMVSPSNTSAGLSRAGPATAADEPERHYPTGLRNYFRTVSPDDLQGVALVELMRSLGVRRAYLLDDAQTSGYGVTRYVHAAARSRRLRIAGATSWPAGPEGLDAMVRRVAAARPDGILLAGCFCSGGHDVLVALRRALPAGTRYFGSDAMMAPMEYFPRPHPATDGMYLAPAGTAADAADPDERAMLGRIGPGRPAASFEPYVIEAARATEALLDAIARSDGSRGSVVDHMRTPAFTATGDPAVGVFSVMRTDRSASTHPEREVAGLVFERLIRVRSERAPRP
jgi:DNA-binding SARP family transcriptional activator/ABC-type branched-subunit amino acid transport system substrate-binding protein